MVRHSPWHGEGATVAVGGGGGVACTIVVQAKVAKSKVTKAKRGIFFMRAVLLGAAEKEGKLIERKARSKQNHHEYIFHFFQNYIIMLTCYHVDIILFEFGQFLSPSAFRL